MDNLLFLDTDTLILKNIDHLQPLLKNNDLGLVEAPLSPLGSIPGISDTDITDYEMSLPSYNSGLIFIKVSSKTRLLFKEVERNLNKTTTFKEDQPILSILINRLNTKVQVLSKNFNYRGRGDLICGSISVWHYPLQKLYVENDKRMFWGVASNCVIIPRNIIVSLILTLKLQVKKITSKWLY